MAPGLAIILNGKSFTVCKRFDGFALAGYGSSIIAAMSQNFWDDAVLDVDDEATQALLLGMLARWYPWVGLSGDTVEILCNGFGDPYSDSKRVYETKAFVGETLGETFWRAFEYAEGVAIRGLK